jgi:uncharacterized cupin superfamily protein
VIDIASLKLSIADAAAMALDPGESFTDLAGAPLATRQKPLWSSSDGTVSALVWEIDAGRFWADFGEYGEIVLIVSGALHCEGDDGSRLTLNPGDSTIFPRGWTGIWSMSTAVRKIAACWLAW